MCRSPACFLVSQSGVEATAQELRDKGITAHAYKCDVTDTRDVRAVAARVRQDLDHVDVLVRTGRG